MIPENFKPIMNQFKISKPSERIKQGRVSSSVGFPFLTKYGLCQYTDPNAPAVFFGCYLPSASQDVRTILNHKGIGLLVWCGTDALQMTAREWYYIKKRKNIRHIAIGKYIANDLKKQGISYISLPLFPGQLERNPCPMGGYVYIYTGKHNRDFYGARILRQLRKATDWQFIEGRGQFGRDEMKGVYRRCFVGLRLTKHDGLPNTVIELGLMGRKCVYNGGLPGSIPWSSVGDIVRAINTESKMIGQVNQQQADAMYNYLNIGDEWLYV